MDSEASPEDEASRLVFCFDFDGVVCDSVDESSTAAWLHAKELWPELELGKNPEPFLEPMRKVRPVVETGWENTLLIRVLSEADVVAAFRAAKRGGGRKRQMPGVMPAYGMSPEADSGVPDLGNEGGVASMICESVMNGWETTRQKQLQTLGLDPQDLIQQYGAVRDKWMSKNMASWLARNKSYDSVPDVMDAMMSRGAEVFIITTKQRRFAKALLADIGLELDDDHLYALEDGPKTEVLKSLLQRPAFADKKFHFIEDKLGTLRRVLEVPELSAVELHLAEWGYCTERDIKIVRGGIVEGISLLSQQELEGLAVSEPWIY